MLELRLEKVGLMCIDILKACTVCNEPKSKDEFYNYKNSKDGKCYRCKSCDTDARIKYKEKHPERVRLLSREQLLRLNYGLSIESYDELFESQDNCCKICGKEEARFVVDHDHDSGKVRSILCNSCNRGLGYFKDSPEVLRKAADYLEVH